MKLKFCLLLLFIICSLKQEIAQTIALKSIGDSAFISKKTGNKNYQVGNYPEALNNYFTALHLYQKADSVKAVADIYNNLGIIYNTLNEYEEALKYHRLALKIREAANDTAKILSSYNNLGNVYNNMGNYNKSLAMHSASLQVNERIKNTRGIANSLSNIGNVYAYQGTYTEALSNYLQALPLWEKLKDTSCIAASYINISEMYIKLKKTDFAFESLNKGLLISRKIANKDNIKDCYRDLALLDSIKGNWTSAYKNYRLYTLYKDSIDNEEVGEKIIQLTLRNEFEVKEEKQKAEQLQKDAVEAGNRKRQNLILGFISLVLLLVIVFAIFAVRSLRITKKQKFIIEERKNEVLRQKEMLAHKNKEVTDSINYAKRIQRALLASDRVLNDNLNKKSNDEPSYFILFQPKDIVSGDFYWAAPLKNGNFALVTADSTGHGVPGAIMSMLNIACLNEAVNGKELSEPNEILNYTRAKIIENLTNDGSAEGGKDGMDCSLICFEHSTNKLQYAAANNPVWIVRQQQLIELQPDKMPVGKHEKDKEPFALNSIELQKGDVIYTLTDGFPDQFGGAKDKKYRSKQLKAFLIEISSLPMNVQKQKLTEEFASWKGKSEQVDDVTIIGIRV